MAPTLFDELKMVTGQKKKNEDFSSECCNIFFSFTRFKTYRKEYQNGHRNKVKTNYISDKG